MAIKGFDSLGEKSKVTVHKVITDSHNGGVGMGDFGKNTHKTMVPFESTTPGAIDPTSDNDDEGVSGRPDTFGHGNKGGASGDGPTPGYNGAGVGQATLNGAQGNMSNRGLAKS